MTQTEPWKDQIVEDLWPLARKLSEFDLDPANARVHSERNLATIQSALTNFKQRKPIVVNRKTMEIEAGNGTFTAAVELGWTHVAAVLVDDDPSTATGYAIADNRAGELASWDEQQLAKLLSEIDDPVDLGFNDEELGALLKNADLSTLPVEGDQLGAPAGEGRSPAGNKTGRRGDFNPVIQYNVVFESEAQQQEWFKFLRRLKAELPDVPTVAGRLLAWSAMEVSK